jgi:hypothetical protein
MFMTIFLAEKEGLGGCCQDSTGLEGGNEAHQQLKCSISARRMNVLLHSL